jgi:hypothetical protein
MEERYFRKKNNTKECVKVMELGCVLFGFFFLYIHSPFKMTLVHLNLM